MDIRNNVLGLGHLGLPSKDVDTTAAFFTQFGFEIDWKGRPDQAVFLRKGSCYIEIYKDDNAALTDGSWQHVALEVSDIEKEYEYARSLGYQHLKERSVQTIAMNMV